MPMTASAREQIADHGTDERLDVLFDPVEDEVVGGVDAFAAQETVDLLADGVRERVESARPDRLPDGL